MNPRLLAKVLSWLCVLCAAAIWIDYGFIQQMEAYSQFPNISETAKTIRELPGGETALTRAGIDHNQNFVKMMVHISRLRGHSNWIALVLVVAGIASLFALSRKSK